VGRALGSLVGQCPRAHRQSGDLGGRAVQDRSIEFGGASGIGQMPHTGPIWLTVRGCATSPLRPYGPLRPLGVLQGEAAPIAPFTPLAPLGRRRLTCASIGPRGPRGREVSCHR
jgi:hypothetical protein